MRVTDQSGNVATYSYDAVGNLLSISRSNLPANNGVAVLGFSPQSGPVRQTVTIQGQGFNSTPSANTVQFNGTAASVTAATSSTLTVSVPAGATTGPISVTTGGQTATSDMNFKVTAVNLNAIAVTTPNSAVSVGQTEQLTATGYYSDGTSKDVTAVATWNSSTPSIATVNSQGLLSALQAGRSGITATINGVTGVAAVFVLGSINSITLSPTIPSLGVGQAQQFAATAQFADGTTLDVTALANWASSSTSVATVSNQAGSQGLTTGVGSGQVTVSASLGGATGSETLNVGLAYNVSGTVYAADGQTPDYSGENVQLYDEATGNYVDGTTSDENGQYSFTNELLTSPNATVTVEPSCPPVGTSLTVSANGSASSGQSMTINVTGPLAVVKGQVLFNDGRGVPDATLVSGFGNTYCSGVVEVGVVRAPGGRSVKAPGAKKAQITEPHGLEGIVYLYPRMPDAQGNFALVGPLKPGPVTLFAGEVDNCLTGTGAGSLTSTSTPATVDVTMPPPGTVSGSVVDANGNPSPGANVSVFNPFCSISTLADGLGNYSQNNVQLGNVVVAASPQANNGIMDFEGAAAGLLNTDDQNVQVNVQLLPTSTVSGTVLDTDGATPIASAQVMIENPSIGGGLADYIYNGYENQQGQLLSDSSGNFSVPNVPVGQVRVLAAGPIDPNNPSGNTAGAFIAGTLAQGSPLVMNPVMGNGYNFGPLSSTYISRSQPFDGLSCDGTTGLFNPFGAGGGPYLNMLNNSASVNVFTSSTFFAPGCSLPSSWVDQLELNGQQIEIAPEPFPGSYLQVGRKAFVPQNGGFTRYLEVLTNPFNAPVTATLNISNGIPESVVGTTASSYTVIVDPSTTGNTYGVLEDLQDSSTSVPAFAFAGVGSAVAANPNFTLQSQSAISYQWTVTVPANQTVILMHFVIQAPDVNTATTQAQALVNLTDPNALYGMTAAEMSEVVNFNVQ